MAELVDARHRSELVREADEKIAAICREMGVREEFRPHLNLSWWSRGENADNQRRTELRKRAQAAIAAQAEQAKYEIDRRAGEVQTQLVAVGLTTEEARNFLEGMPTVESLMVPIDVGMLEAQV